MFNVLIFYGIWNYYILLFKRLHVTIVTDFKIRGKVHYKFVKLAPKSMGQVISTLFKSQEKFVQYLQIPILYWNKLFDASK